MMNPSTDPALPSSAQLWRLCSTLSAVLPWHGKPLKAAGKAEVQPTMQSMYLMVRHALLESHSRLLALAISKIPQVDYDRNAGHNSLQIPAQIFYPNRNDDIKLQPSSLSQIPYPALP